MDIILLKKKRAQRRKKRIKKKLRANKNALRLCINRSNKNISAQIIDDEKSVTMVAVSTLSKDFSDKKNKANIESAIKLGEMIAEKALEKGIKNVVFDRNGLLYHGKIKAFADAAREKGLEF